LIPATLADLILVIQIFYDCFLAFELVFMYFFAVETKNHTLEETAAIFDGEEALEIIAAVGEEGIRHHGGESSSDEKVGLEKDEPVHHLSA
jgi:hypothetical protein